MGDVVITYIFLSVVFVMTVMKQHSLLMKTSINNRLEVIGLRILLVGHIVLNVLFNIVVILHYGVPGVNIEYAFNTVKIALLLQIVPILLIQWLLIYTNTHNT